MEVEVEGVSTEWEPELNPAAPEAAEFEPPIHLGIAHVVVANGGSCSYEASLEAPVIELGPAASSVESLPLPAPAPAPALAAAPVPPVPEPASLDSPQGLTTPIVLPTANREAHAALAFDLFG